MFCFKILKGSNFIMVNSVSSTQDIPVKTVQIFDPDKKQLRKLANKSDVVNKYIQESNKATKKLFVDAGVGALSVGIAGLGGRLLYDGIKKKKFSGMKALLAGMFAAISGFFAIAVVEYKKNVQTIVKKFIAHSEEYHPLENKFGVEYRIPDIKEDNA